MKMAAAFSYGVGMGLSEFEMKKLQFGLVSGDANKVAIRRFSRLFRGKRPTGT